MSIIMLDQAKAHLRIVIDDEDDYIQDLIDAAESSASDYLQRTLYATQDDLNAAVDDYTVGCNPIVITGAIRAACYLMIGNLYANREAVVDSRAAVELPLGTRYLLDPLRADMGV